ncbi:MAG TPA: ABC transporter permease [Gemmatimonadales bacterium]
MKRPHRVFRLGGRRQVERDVDQEISFHIQARTQKLIDAGCTPVEARQRALAQFGDLPGVRSECLTLDHQRERAMQWSELAGHVAADARQAWRSLTRQPGFTLAVILILAIGIGANTAIFTLIDGFLLRTLPVPHAEQLVTIGDPAAVDDSWNGSAQTDYVSYPVYTDIRTGNRTLSDVYATGSPGDLDVVFGGSAAAASAPEHPRGRLVSENYFSVLQVGAAAGRVFSTADNHGPGSDPVAVVSYGYWQRRLAGDRAVVGRSIDVNGVPITIIGVAPRWFSGDIVGEGTDIWLPIMMQPALARGVNRVDQRSTSWLLMMGRVAPGSALARARSEIATIEVESIRSHLTGDHLARFDEGLKTDPVRVEPGARGFSPYRSTFAPALTVLMAAVALIVLIVCANVANLMLSRAVARAREMTVRMTLGARRLRLIQQLLTESVVLAVLAAIPGLFAAFWGSRLLLTAAASGPDPIPLDVRPDLRVLAFTAIVTLLSAMLFGLLPALHATRIELAGALRTSGRNLAGGRHRLGRFAVGKVLVAAQCAFSMLLLVGTGLLLRSMQRIRTADLGFDRDRMVLVDVSTARSGYDSSRREVLVRELADRARHVPGVAAVSYAEDGTFSGGRSGGHVTVAGYTAPADSDRQVMWDAVGPDYFHAIGAHLLRGRDFDERDSKTGAKVTVINETMTRRYFAGRDPIGGLVTYDSSTYTVIGEVRDIQEYDVRAKPEREMYLSIFQAGPVPKGFILQVRVSGDPRRAVAPLRTALLAADPTLAMDVQTLNNLVRDSVAEDRLLVQVTTFFGLVALLLTAIGLYGVTAYTTRQRTAEFGLRLALGAEPTSLTRLVLREAVALVAIGVVVGLPCGLAATRLLQHQLFGVAAADPESFGVAIMVLIGTALVASYLPARRAMRVTPVEALRSD